MTYTLIAHTELGSAQANITFSSIPATFTDLQLVISARMSDSAFYAGYRININGVQTNFSRRALYGDGSSAASDSQTSVFFNAVGGAATANIFTSNSLYIANYRAAVPKSMSYETILENNATTSLQLMGAGLWNVNDAITSLQLVGEGSNFLQFSSATLYGITAGSTPGVTVS
jgi:hypothetical protein